MVDQLDLFSTTSCDFEEEQKNKEQQRNVALKLERLKQERNEFLTKSLTTRQHRLVDYLNNNFQSGKYFTIEEICSADLGYTLNTNPRIHDKCASLGSDKFECIVNDSQIPGIPLPGTYQYGRPVTVLNKEDFE